MSLLETPCEVYTGHPVIYIQVIDHCVSRTALVDVESTDCKGQSICWTAMIHLEDT